MNHRPFEDWLFSGEPLTPQEAAALQEHLQICESCCLLSTTWQEVENQLHGTPMLEPEPGFKQRWQERLEIDRRRLHRRQSLAVLSFHLVGAALLLASIGILALPLIQSPNVLFWTWLYRLFGLITIVDTFQDLLPVLFQTATGVIPFTWWVIFAGVLSELTVLWIVSLRLLTNPRRVSK